MREAAIAIACIFLCLSCKNQAEEETLRTRLSESEARVASLQGTQQPAPVIGRTAQTPTPSAAAAFDFRRLAIEAPALDGTIVSCVLSQVQQPAPVTDYYRNNHMAAPNATVNVPVHCGGEPGATTYMRNGAVPIYVNFSAANAPAALRLVDGATIQVRTTTFNAGVAVVMYESGP